MVQQEIEKRLNEKLDIAEEGRQLWEDLINKFQIKENEYIILFPTKNEEYNKAGIELLEDFLNGKKSNRAVVLSCYDEIINSTDFSDKVETSFISEEDIYKLITIYRLYMFTNQLYIISLDVLDEDFEKKLISLGMSVYDIVKDVTFKIK